MRLRYVIVLEKAADNWCAYSPDVPGCVTTGPTKEATRSRMREALRFHIDGLRDDGEPLPEPLSSEAEAEVLELDETGLRAQPPLARHG